MIADFWNELFQLGEEIKDEYGSKSPQYQTIRELDRRFQKVYDAHNEITEEMLAKPPDGVSDYLVQRVEGLTVLKDGDEYRYRIGHQHFDTPAEVLYFLIEDHNSKYNALTILMDDALYKSVECSAIKMYNRACAEFHQEIEKRKPHAKRVFEGNLDKEAESE